jgi:uncharacterized glyoxalase superfamily metalloenzyme YdcJ
MWQLRAKFAAALSQIYGSEVRAYTTLVEVSAEINRDCAASMPGAERLGSLQQVTAERHGAIRVGSARELADVADLFAAFGMYPVGFYDLRDASSPVPVVSAAFRPIDSNELARNPGLAYYHGGDPSKPVVYEDFLPASAAGIFRSNLDTDTRAAEAADNSDYSLDWLAGQIGHHIHDPYDLYEKVASS